MTVKLKWAALFLVGLMSSCRRSRLALTQPSSMVQA